MSRVRARVPSHLCAGFEEVSNQLLPRIDKEEAAYPVESECGNQSRDVCHLFGNGSVLDIGASHDSNIVFKQGSTTRMTGKGVTNGT